MYVLGVVRGLMHIGSQPRCGDVSLWQFAVVQSDLLLWVRTHLKWRWGSVSVSAYQWRRPHSGTLPSAAGVGGRRLLTDLSAILQDIGRRSAPPVPDVAAALPLMFFRGRRRPEGLTDGRGGGGCFGGLRRVMSGDKSKLMYAPARAASTERDCDADVIDLMTSYWPLTTEHWPVDWHISGRDSRSVLCKRFIMSDGLSRPFCPFPSLSFPSLAFPLPFRRIEVARQIQLRDVGSAVRSPPAGSKCRPISAKRNLKI